jgi:hypothetical protein
MDPLLPWPALLWLLPFAPRLIAAARLARRKHKSLANVMRAMQQQAQQTLKH